MTRQGVPADRVQAADRIASAVCSAHVPHSAFRLYVLLCEACSQAGITDLDLLPVTLEGLLEAYPGPGGRRPGIRTVEGHLKVLEEAGLIKVHGTLWRSMHSQGSPARIEILPVPARPRIRLAPESGE